MAKKTIMRKRPTDRNGRVTPPHQATVEVSAPTKTAEGTVPPQTHAADPIGGGTATPLKRMQLCDVYEGNPALAAQNTPGGPFSEPDQNGVRWGQESAEMDDYSRTSYRPYIDDDGIVGYQISGIIEDEGYHTIPSRSWYDPPEDVPYPVEVEYSVDMVYIDRKNNDAGEVVDVFEIMEQDLQMHNGGGANYTGKGFIEIPAQLPADEAAKKLSSEFSAGIGDYELPEPDFDYDGY